MSPSDPFSALRDENEMLWKKLEERECCGHEAELAALREVAKAARNVVSMFTPFNHDENDKCAICSLRFALAAWEKSHAK